MNKVQDRLEEELEERRKQLRNVQNHLDHEYMVLRESKHEIFKFETIGKEIVDDIKDIKEEIKEEETKIRCPKCSREFSEEYILNNLRQDTLGEYWRCPNRMCNFQGYREQGKYTIEFKEMKAMKDKHYQEFLEKTFKSIETFIK